MADIMKIPIKGIKIKVSSIKKNKIMCSLYKNISWYEIKNILYIFKITYVININKH